MIVIGREGRSDTPEQERWNDAYTEWSWQATSLGATHSDAKVTSSPVDGVE